MSLAAVTSSSAGLKETIRLAEWDRRVFRDLRLSSHDRVLAATLSESPRRVIVRFLEDGLEVQTFSWVGVIELSEVIIVVEPKLPGDAVHLVEMLALTTGIDALQRSVGQRHLQVEREGSLFDLLAMLFCDLAEKVVREGLLADYVERGEDLPVIRGRFLPDRQVLRRLGRLDRVECRYDDHSSDIDENRILALALNLCRLRSRHDQVRRQSRQLHDLFIESCDLEGFDWRETRQTMRYNRLNDHYREAHELAWILLEGSVIEDPLAIGTTESFSFLIDMNRLFERFVERWCAWALRDSDADVSFQQRTPLVIRDRRGRTYSTLIPDVVVTTGGGTRKFTIDAKYKKYDLRKISEGDIYQGFLYAYAFARNDRPRAVILYPASSPGVETKTLKLSNPRLDWFAEIDVMGIHLPQAIEEMRSGRAGVGAQRLRGMVGG